MKSLIAGYLERISSKVFDDYHAEITSLVTKQHGVYALYKRDRLYYVGLAKDLRNRVKYHLKDKHAKKWDTFSLFLIHRTEHLKELEALLIHIAEPKGNMQRGTFIVRNDLKGTLKSLIESRNQTQLENILGTVKKKKTEKAKQLTAPHKAPKGLVLHKLLAPGAQIKATYKGKEILATIDEQGKILLNGKLFNSPSSAGVAVIDRSTVNGWRFWKYQNPEGKWVALAELLAK
jgi:Restriction Enzyme Adenine Methylase Associated/GIY-YIG catalytic domain